MQFNYNVTGLKADLAGAMLKGEQMRTLRADRKREEEAEKQKLERENSFKKFYKAYEADVQAGGTGTKYLKKMTAIDPERTTTIVDMNANLEDIEKQSLADTINEAKLMADNGDINGARLMLQERDKLLQEYGSGNSFTQPLSNAAEGADDLDFLRVLDRGYDVATGMGLIEEPEIGKKQGVFFDEKGKEYIMYQNADGTMQRRYTGDSREADIAQERKKAALEGKNIRLTQDQSQRTGDLKDHIDDSKRMVKLTQSLANDLSDIASRDEWDDKGVAAAVNDAVRSVFGAEGEDEFTRIRANKARNIIALADRAPGATSNFEFKKYLSGVPSATANPALQAEYYRALAEGAQLEQGLDRIEGSFIEQSKSMFSSFRDFKVRADGITVEVKAGDTVEDVQNRWLEKANERKGKQLEEERQRNAKFEEMYSVD
jgi:hypothetical protein